MKKKSTERVIVSDEYIAKMLINLLEKGHMPKNDGEQIARRLIKLYEDNKDAFLRVYKDPSNMVKSEAGNEQLSDAIHKVYIDPDSTLSKILGELQSLKSKPTKGSVLSFMRTTDKPPATYSAKEIYDILDKYSWRVGIAGGDRTSTKNPSAYELSKFIGKQGLKKEQSDLGQDRSIKLIGAVLKIFAEDKSPANDKGPMEKVLLDLYKHNKEEFKSAAKGYADQLNDKGFTANSSKLADIFQEILPKHTSGYK